MGARLAKVNDRLPCRIGTAGWNIPSQIRDLFPKSGAVLQRYSSVFNCVEINSSFYRDHKPETYARWSDSVPPSFLFSVKLSRYFTQETRLEDVGGKLKQVLEGISHLKEKWGILLVQLPPSLDFKEKIVGNFLGKLRDFYSGTVVWEPRHKSWATEEAAKLFLKFGIRKVVADPEPCPVSADFNQAVRGAVYFRLHGSPEIYKSRYSEKYIRDLAEKVQLQIKEAIPQTWIVFDNTTFGYASENALELQALTGSKDSLAKRG